MKFDLDFFKKMAAINDSKLEPRLLMAIAQTESALNASVVRYEPAWKYHLAVDLWARKTRITSNTEKVLQSMSWGLMQVMGSVAREHGFDKCLTELIDPNFNVLIGIRKLEQLSKKYKNLDEVISSYNQGFARRGENGELLNSRYVSTVLGFYNSLN